MSQLWTFGFSGTSALFSCGGGAENQGMFRTFLNIATVATEGLPAAATTAGVIIGAIVILRRDRSRPEPGPYPLEVVGVQTGRFPA